jgi:hypothetical protein
MKISPLRLMLLLILIIFINIISILLQSFIKLKITTFESTEDKILNHLKLLDASRSFKRDPTIFCIILTSSKNFDTKIKIIFETWVKYYLKF